MSNTTKTYVTSKEEYTEEIKKMLPEIKTLEALKSIYEMTLICLTNEKKEILPKDGN